MMRDLSGYAGLVALGVVPAVDWTTALGADAASIARLVYFALLAVGTVYVGAQRQDIGEAAPISRDNAVLAPVVASASLGGLYVLLKYTELNPALIYQVGACAFALVSAVELLAPAIGLGLAGRLLTGASLDSDERTISEEEDERMLTSGQYPAIALTLALLGGYALGPTSNGGSLDLPAFACLNNYLGWSIATVSLGVLSLESFTTGAFLLGGLFCYDAFFVFQTEIMYTVATSVEAPARFLFAAARELGDQRYPFSVLGLGDVVIPGAFVALMRQRDLDCEAQPAAAPLGGLETTPYFRSALVAYGLGLALCFTANYVTQSGQPALVYIVPSLLIAAVATAAGRGELKELLGYRSARAIAAAAAVAREKEEEQRRRK